ncbi:OLC1v1027542C1 [Oldenlandia corymbosa var. corymbosa]|uniref:OLC1v1027542C1 n=1 Tax=Oldenlandia corymbosa var. corymbosa TaxID=529605 RepID=A0AAV1CBQ2_OLDCO|nr:OLC1v1027542C1 [Oldenlandia corymbosa var. corymbosa]
MESSCSQSLSTIESFSHSWLPISSSSSPSCGNSFDADEASSFIEMDPKMPSSRRFSRVPKDFSFDFRTNQLPVSLADADQLISPDGVLVPLSGEFPLISDNNNHHTDGEDRLVGGQSELVSPNTSIPNIQKKEKHSSSSSSSSNRVRCASLRRCKRLSERILGFLKPICQKLQGRGSCTSRVASIGSSSGGGLMHEERHETGRRSWEYYSPATSPRTSVAWSVDHNWRRSCDSESSIYEAVLHCKRTHHGK